LPTEREADDAAADLELFAGREPLFYPSWETAPDERLELMCRVAEEGRRSGATRDPDAPPPAPKDEPPSTTG
jgi:hypothetical protein